ncbi:MAG TPA: glutaredoxin [Dokdonella sp.]
MLFSTSTCPYGRRVRALLADAHVAYRDFVVDASDDAEQRFRALDGSAVPLLFVGPRRIRRPLTFK